MKKIILLLQCSLMAFLINGQVISDTLYLKIPSLTASRIVLQFNRNPAFPPDANFSPSSGTWILKVSGTDNAAIELMNTEGGEKVELKGGIQQYVFTGHSLNEPVFVLSKNLRLQIKNKNTGAEVKTYLIKYDNTTVGINNGSGTNTTTNVTTGASVPPHNVGSVIYDALYLRKGTSDAVKAKILAYYQMDKNQRDLRIAYADNKFLLPFINSFSFTGAQASVGLGSLFSSIGGLDVTAFADGMAKFLVKRVKQELSLAFFHKFKRTIDSLPDLKTVFPQTSYLLQAIDNEIYNYKQYVQNLREAFKKDLVEIHRNLPGIVDNHTAFFKTHPVAKAGLLTSCYMAQQLDDGSHPGDMLAAYPVEYLGDIGNKNYKAAIQTVQLLSASLRDTAKNEGYWVNIKTVRELVNDKEATRLYLGLLLQEAKLRYESVPYQGQTLVEFLNAAAAQYDAAFNIYISYRNYILRFGEKVEALNKLIKQYEEDEKTSDSARIEKYAKYFRNSVDLVDYCTQASSLPGIAGNIPDLRLLLGKYFEIGYLAADVTVNITRKNYSAVVNNAVRIYNLVRGEVIAEPSLTIALNDVEMASLQKSRGGFKKTLESLTRYGSFMATIATAKTSDEVESAIEGAALPVGSSRIKRVSDFNVSLNAYAGLFYGTERIQGLDEGAWQANVYGVTAPIGVAASWGHRLLFFKTGKKEWSTSLFLSLIDLGTVAAFRFTDDSTEQIPTIQLKHIFSPGAFLSLGIPGTPLSFNFGAQAGPNLRKVQVEAGKENEFADNIYWRFSTSLVVDIPILNFHTKSN